MSTPRMSDEDLKRFVLGYCDGQVFTNRQIQNQRDVLSVFMPLIFLDEAERDIDDVGIIWEWLNEAGPRSINGYPIFVSARLMHRDDWERARVAIKRELERREEIEI